MKTSLVGRPRIRRLDLRFRASVDSVHWSAFLVAISVGVVVGDTIVGVVRISFVSSVRGSRLSEIRLLVVVFLFVFAVCVYQASFLLLVRENLFD